MNSISVHLRVGHLMSPAGFGWQVEGGEPSKAAPFPVVTWLVGKMSCGKAQPVVFFLFILSVGLSDPFSQADFSLFLCCGSPSDICCLCVFFLEVRTSPKTNAN